MCLCVNVWVLQKKDDDDDKVKVKDDGSRVWKDIAAFAAVMMVIETPLIFFRSSDFVHLHLNFCATVQQQQRRLIDSKLFAVCVLCSVSSPLWLFALPIDFVFVMWWCVEPLSLLTNWLTDWLSRRTDDWKVSNAFDVMRAQKLKEDQILGACHRQHYNSNLNQNNKRNDRMAAAPGKGRAPMMAPVNKLGKWGWVIVRCLAGNWIL